jgi:hypothetical protein
MNILGHSFQTRVVNGNKVMAAGMEKTMKATRIIVATIGVILGIAGIDHGFFETLQGNTPTNGLIIQAIGEANRMWLHGTEEAFTIIPNFLATGILAIMVSLAIMIWSVGFVHKKHGPTVFILLYILLFMVGGGIGQIVFFLPTWAVSTRINRPLTWWQKVLPENIRRVLAKLWPVFLTIGSLLFLIALEIAIWGFVPSVNDPEQKLYICWSLLGAGLGTYLLTFVAGFAHDIQA